MLNRESLQSPTPQSGNTALPMVMVSPEQQSFDLCLLATGNLNVEYEMETE
jgi:hypothetical protein